MEKYAIPYEVKKALESIAYPIATIQKEAEEQDNQVNGAMLIEFVKQPSYYKDIAVKILKKIK